MLVARVLGVGSLGFLTQWGVHFFFFNVVTLGLVGVIFFLKALGGTFLWFFSSLKAAWLLSLGGVVTHPACSLSYFFSLLTLLSLPAFLLYLGTRVPWWHLDFLKPKRLQSGQLVQLVVLFFFLKDVLLFLASLDLFYSASVLRRQTGTRLLFFFFQLERAVCYNFFWDFWLLALSAWDRPVTVEGLGNLETELMLHWAHLQDYFEVELWVPTPPWLKNRRSGIRAILLSQWVSQFSIFGFKKPRPLVHRNLRPPLRSAESLVPYLFIPTRGYISEKYVTYGTLRPGVTFLYANLLHFLFSKTLKSDFELFTRLTYYNQVSITLVTLALPQHSRFFFALKQDLRALVWAWLQFAGNWQQLYFVIFWQWDVLFHTVVYLTARSGTLLYQFLAYLRFKLYRARLYLLNKFYLFLIIWLSLLGYLDSWERRFEKYIQKYIQGWVDFFLLWLPYLPVIFTIYAERVEAAALEYLERLLLLLEVYGEVWLAKIFSQREALLQFVCRVRIFLTWQVSEWPETNRYLRFFFFFVKRSLAWVYFYYRCVVSPQRGPKQTRALIQGTYPILRFYSRLFPEIVVFFEGESSISSHRKKYARSWLYLWLLFIGSTSLLFFFQLLVWRARYNLKIVPWGGRGSHVRLPLKPEELSRFYLREVRLFRDYTSAFAGNNFLASDDIRGVVQGWHSSLNTARAWSWWSQCFLQPQKKEILSFLLTLDPTYLESRLDLLASLEPSQTRSTPAERTVRLYETQLWLSRQRTSSEFGVWFPRLLVTLNDVYGLIDRTLQHAAEEYARPYPEWRTKESVESPREDEPKLRQFLVNRADVDNCRVQLLRRLSQVEFSFALDRYLHFCASELCDLTRARVFTPEPISFVKDWESLHRLYQLRVGMQPSQVDVYATVLKNEYAKSYSLSYRDKPRARFGFKLREAHPRIGKIFFELTPVSSFWGLPCSPTASTQGLIFNFSFLGVNTEARWLAREVRLMPEPSTRFYQAKPPQRKEVVGVEVFSHPLLSLKLDELSDFLQKRALKQKEERRLFSFFRRYTAFFTTHSRGTFPLLSFSFFLSQDTLYTLYENQGATKHKFRFQRSTEQLYSFVEISRYNQLTQIIPSPEGGRLPQGLLRKKIPGTLRLAPSGHTKTFWYGPRRRSNRHLLFWNYETRVSHVSVSPLYLPNPELAGCTDPARVGRSLSSSHLRVCLGFFTSSFILGWGRLWFFKFFFFFCELFSSCHYWVNFRSSSSSRTNNLVLWLGAPEDGIACKQPYNSVT